MSIALKEAKKAYRADEVPVGCVIVKDDEIIAKAHNLKEKKMQAWAHAEMLAIQKATKKLNNYYLTDCDLYVTLEPCMMCTGIIELSRIKTVYYGTTDPKGGCVDTLIDVRHMKHINHHLQVVSGILQEECSSILTSFFREKRALTKQKKQG